MKAIVVDDEALILKDILRQLDKISMIESAEGFSNPLEALESLVVNDADVALLDINMGAADGLTVAKKMREVKPEIAIIFITGYSEYAVDAFGIHADGYLLKPVTKSDIEKELAHLSSARQKKSIYKIRVQTFGSFEVFADDIPLHFGRAKAKELFARLVDRRGAALTPPEISSVLWEDEEYNISKLKQIHTFIADMCSTLKLVGAEDVIVRQYKSLSVNMSLLDCDYCRFLNGDKAAAASFGGEYMSQYSWAEETAGALCAIKGEM